MRRVQGCAQAQVEIVRQRVEFACEPGLLAVVVADLALDHLHAAATGLQHDGGLRVVCRLGFREACFECGARPDQAEGSTQFGEARFLSLQRFLLSAGGTGFLDQRPVAILQAVLFIGELLLLRCQHGLLAALIGIPFAEPVVDPGAKMQDLSA